MSEQEYTKKFELCLVLGGVLGVLSALDRSGAWKLLELHWFVLTRFEKLGLMMLSGSILVVVLVFVLIFAEAVESKCWLEKSFVGWQNMR